MTSSNPSHQNKKITWLVLFPAILVITTWTRLSQHTFWLAQKIAIPLILELITCLFISFAFCMFLAQHFGEKKHHYHYAFLFTIGINLILLITARTNPLILQVLLRLLPMTLGAFLGCFLASNIQNGFWENNAPPSPLIEEEVLAQHRNHMGRITRQTFKRLLDMIFALISLTLSLPIWLVISFLIWWEDPGPVLFVKNSVGLAGKNFRQLKFRSMIINAEKDTGPISGYENDERVLFIGKFIRKTALDELPQLINILIGDMSYVGPRPQRTVLVHGYIQSLPLYTARHRIRPGLAGLAQVADSYHITPEEKLAWDLDYINKANAWFDLKLVFAAFFLVFALRWRPQVHPELTIRKILKIAKPSLPNNL